PRRRLDINALDLKVRRADDAQAEALAPGEPSQRVLQRGEVLRRAVAARPADDGNVVLRARLDRVLLRVDGRRDDGHAVVDAARVVGQVRVAGHDVRGHAADRARLAGKLQVAQVAVRRADVTLEDGVVEVEDEGDARAPEPALEERRAEER